MKRTAKQIMADAWKRLLTDLDRTKWAILLLVAYFALTGFLLHSVCPMVLITGLPCPACGLTRAGRMLFRLDFKGAFRMHPFIYPAVALMAAYGVERYGMMRRRASRTLKWLLILLIAGMIFFYIWRMYQYFPGEPPMSFYPHALIVFLWNLW